MQYAAGQRISAGEQEVVGIFAAGDLDWNFLLGGAFEDLRAGHACGLRQRIDLVGEGMRVGSVEAPEECAGGVGGVDAEWTVGRGEVDTGRIQRRVGRLAREAPQCGGKAM